MPSSTPTRYAIICSEHGQVFLTREEYDLEMRNPDSRWTCPHCKRVAQFDDDNYEAL